MNKNRFFHIVVLCMVFVICGVEGIFAEDIRVVTPYLGALANTYEDSSSGTNLEDTSMMKGLYLQWVRPELFQTNLFVYQVSDINYSNLWGIHGIFDLYFDVKESSKNVIGLGFQYLSLDMDAGNEITPLSNFELKNDINSFYVRLGRYFYVDFTNVGLSFMPWMGTEFDMVNGDLSFVPPGPPMTISKDIDEDTVLAIYGINVKLNLYHIFEIKVKYSGAFDADDYYNRFEVMNNIYFSRNWGLSYRFHYNESSTGLMYHHLGGIVYSF